MASLLHSLRRFFAQPQVREFLLWCLPALLAGFVLRAVLTAQLPYAVYHDDSGDLLVTPYKVIMRHEWEIHGKKTFLVPTAYTVLVLLHIPLLLAVPLIQHVLGLIMIVLVGLLCRLWFARWRWFIVPLTLLIAVNPALLWYEHLLMPETTYVFFTTLLAVAGTLYALDRSWPRFAFLCGTLFLEAGARPEGKLLFGFAFFLLVLVHWRAWRLLWVRFALLAVLAAGTFYITQTGQAGLLLYTSVARMTPRELKAAPGFDPYIAAIRADLAQRWEADLSFPRVADRRAIGAAVYDYMVARNPGARHPGHTDTNDLCMKLASETCRKNFFQLPAYFYQKFRYTTREPTYGALDRRWLFDRQKVAFNGNQGITSTISKLITGSEVGTAPAYAAFLDAHYQEIGWFNAYSSAWNDAIYSFRVPDEVRYNGAQKIVIPRLPYFYLAAAFGLVLVMFRRGLLQPLHIAWGMTLLALFYTIILTANIRGRFRFGMEPFWYLYIGIIFDSLVFWLLPKRPAPAAPASPSPAP